MAKANSSQSSRKSENVSNVAEAVVNEVKKKYFTNKTLITILNDDHKFVGLAIYSQTGYEFLEYELFLRNYVAPYLDDKQNAVNR
ncbi:MAG: hypothetical protein OXF77_02585, partial [Thaumarchaeota archaeon]|nr:hypothetical protein [Nitrososphaerota archaeon]